METTGYVNQDHQVHIFNKGGDCPCRTCRRKRIAAIYAERAETCPDLSHSNAATLDALEWALKHTEGSIR